MADKQKVDLGLLEEDDEFEEFPTESKCFKPSHVALNYYRPREFLHISCFLLLQIGVRKTLMMRMCPFGKITGKTTSCKTISINN